MFVGHRHHICIITILYYQIIISQLYFTCGTLTDLVRPISAMSHPITLVYFLHTLARCPSLAPLLTPATVNCPPEVIITADPGVVTAELDPKGVKTVDSEVGTQDIVTNTIVCN